MESIFAALGDLQQDEALDALGRRLGTDRNTAGKAVAAALPALISALSRNARTSDGAQSLAGAIARDHDGGILDDVVGALAGGGSRRDERILDHVFGGRRAPLQQQLGRGAGLDGAGMGRVLAALAPVVLGALGRAQRQGTWDAGDLAGALQGEGRRLQERDPDASSLFEKLLDSDGDGQVADDVAAIGARVLGRFFSR